MVTRAARVLGMTCSCAVLFALSCKTEQLSDKGANVITSRSAPVDSGWDPARCTSLGYIIGRGGGAFGGSWISNEDLIEYAMNDLRNQAADLGANYIQHDTPTMGVAGGDGGTTTTTATVTGTAYRCKQKMRPPPRHATEEVARPEPDPEPDPEPKAERACVPGATQACVGPGGCSGGQFCLDDGSRFSRCDCGQQSEAVVSDEDERSL